MLLNVAHVSESPTTPLSGMGRVQYHWNKEILNRGHSLLQVEKTHVGKVAHPAFFPFSARKYLRSHSFKPTLMLCHEPASGIFCLDKYPVFLVSHGVEARRWQLALDNRKQDPMASSFKTRIAYPIWRLALAELGMRRSYKILLLNEEDANFVQIKYKRRAEDIKIFRNGCYTDFERNSVLPFDKEPIIFWNASWLERKGKDVFINALLGLFEKGINFKCIIAGGEVNKVLQDFPVILHPKLEIVHKFDQKKEQEMLNRSSIFVLASYFEGQPLSLLQALASGLCCVASNNSGQKDLIESWETGVLFETGNEKDLIDKLEVVLKDINRRQYLSMNASQKYKSWSWQTVSKEIIDFVEDSI